MIQGPGSTGSPDSSGSCGAPGAPPGAGAAFEVIDGGLQTTVQDAGRPDLGAQGVPRSGACDPTSLAVANLLIGNEPDLPVLEATIVGPEMLALADVVIGLAGADLGAVVEPAGRCLAPGAVHRLRAGERLTMPGSSAPDAAGCRAYISVAGGFAVERVLGSASTSLVGGFGGLEGRALRAGDWLAIAGHQPGGQPRGRVVGWPSDLALPSPTEAVSVIAGPAAATPAGASALGTFLASSWRIASASDRRGLRLEGPSIDLDVAADAPSVGVPTGTVQVTPSGLPIVLLADAGPTGGYPILALVTTAALSIVGQARPGGSMRFRLVDVEAARAEERERRHVLAAGAARLERSDPWDDLPDLAGA